jgi:asparagine synthetase B (glutamine-hydrolysing)
VHWAGGQRYRSTARVVLLGHGADELCAGYGRHRTRFREQACL